MPVYASTEQILDAYQALGDNDLANLLNYASSIIQGTSFSEGLDLVHEALDRSLSGRRNWKIGLNFAIYLRKTMQSIASNERGSKLNLVRNGVAIDELPEQGSRLLPASPSAEDEASHAETVALSQRILREVQRALASDALASQVLDQMLEDKPSTEIQESLAIDYRQFDAAYHRVKRCIDKHTRLH